MEYETFFRAAGPTLLRICFLATLDREVAADAAQETMARAWKHWNTIRTGNPEAWVRTVALNICRGRWRKLARETRLAPRAYVVDGPAPALPDIDLQRALARLSARQREAVALFYFSDLSVADCATTMKTSEGSVKSYLSRAREQLARDLSQEVEFS